VPAQTQSTSADQGTPADDLMSILDDGESVDDLYSGTFSN
jgi:hypothetical protein